MCSSDLNDNALNVRVNGMLSLTANPDARKIVPEQVPRRFRLVLNFEMLREDFLPSLFPIYYLTDHQFYTTTPPSWLVQYYKDKGLGWEVEAWNTAPFLYLDRKLFSYESEWKCMADLFPLELYLVRIEYLEGAQ